MATIIAKGLWCNNCDVFEEDEIDAERCMACGCPSGTHIDVEIITAAESGSD